MYGPTTAISMSTHQEKYRSEGESFEERMRRIAHPLSDSEEHKGRLVDMLLEMRFMPAGRVQAAVGNPRRNTTASNCFVLPSVPDSMDGIMRIASEAAATLRLGGGVGLDFSRIRPWGDIIKTLESHASGPVSFMQIFDATCRTIASAGHRRGAMMIMLRVDHPDIRRLINAKQDEHSLTSANISVAVTDEFMRAVERGDLFPLRFEGRVYEEVDARTLWNEITESARLWAEPGVVFIDTINRENNLWYCEDIAATNPCSEQPLPPYGACLLGSFNLPKYIHSFNDGFRGFDYRSFCLDILVAVRAMDNVIENSIYPLSEQETEAKAKRRIGLGVTGLANAIETLGFPYGSLQFVAEAERIMKMLRDAAYSASVSLAKEKGAFPLFVRERYMESPFIQRLPGDIQREIYKHGIRNSHLISLAPTGTISLCADNVSSGIEPVFAHSYTRDILTPKGLSTETVEDYGLSTFGVRGRTAHELTPQEHLDVLLALQPYVDSSISKTVNVPEGTSREALQHLYFTAWRGGAKGLSTFTNGGKREGPLRPIAEGVTACLYDPTTGKRSCD